jgi:hypothetical protein
MFGLVAIIPACLVGALMAKLTHRTTSRLKRALIVLLLGLAEVAMVALLVSLTSGSLDGVVPVLEMLVWPVYNGVPNAIGIAFFWVPFVLQAAYVVSAQEPRWEVAALVSGAAVFCGLLFFLVGGVATGATSD